MRVELSKAQNYVITLIHECTPARGSVAGGAAEAMFAGYNSPRQQVRSIKASDMIWGTVVHRAPQRQIEVAVVQCSVPSDAELMPTHKLIDRMGIKRLLEQL